MPKVLPSFDFPRANLVSKGSAVVTAWLTRDRGVSRSAGPAEEETGGVSGRPPKELNGAGAGVPGVEPNVELPGDRLLPNAELLAGVVL
jgi:hypothetical protein